MSIIMRKFNSLVLALCIISCTANQNDVNVVDRSISETKSSTAKKDEISPMKTKFVWGNSFGEEFPVYINSHGSCFIIKKSKSGKSYRSYLGEEVLKQINNELSNRKINNVVAQDTISSFWGKPIVINDKICEQISAIAAQDKKLSYSDSIIQIVNVRWRVNIKSNNIVLMTSVQPDDPKMKQVVKYLTGIYGKPYEDEEDGYDIKWSSSDDPLNIFRPGCTLVHLRRILSEEGGTCLIFQGR